MDTEIESKLTEFLSLYEGSSIHLKNGNVVPFDLSSLRGLAYRAILDIEESKCEIKKLKTQIENTHSGTFKYTLQDFIRDMKNPENLEKFKSNLIAMQKDITDSLNKKSAS